MPKVQKKPLESILEALKGLKFDLETTKRVIIDASFAYYESDTQNEREVSHIFKSLLELTENLERVELGSFPLNHPSKNSMTNSSDE